MRQLIIAETNEATLSIELDRLIECPSAKRNLDQALTKQLKVWEVTQRSEHE